VAKPKSFKVAYERLRNAVHALLNVTTNPPEVERPLRELLYGDQEIRPK